MNDIATAPKAKTVIRLTETDLLAKGHTHIVTGSLRYDEVATKQKVTINTVVREIATSDLHQCRTTEATKEAMDRAKRNSKAKAKRAAKKDDMPIVIEGLDESVGAPVVVDVTALLEAELAK